MTKSKMVKLCCWVNVVLGVSLLMSGVATVTAGPPVIDISSLFDADIPEPASMHESWLATLQEMDQALREHGVFVVTHHGIEEDEEKSAFRSAQELFSLPMEEKEAVNINKLSDFGRGYLSFGSESGLSEIFEPKEGYSYGYPYLHNETKNMLNGPNTWPASFSGTQRQPLDNIYMKFTRVANSIVKNLLQYRKETMLPASSEIAEDGTAAKVNTRSTSDIQVDGGEYISLMRLFHYFPLQSNIVQEKSLGGKKALGSSPHTDWGLLTVILQNDVTGLQYMHHGEWVDVPYIPRSLIINIGDFFSLSSNGDYHSPVHRVLCPQERDRTSFVLFFYPKYDSNLVIYEGDSVVDVTNKPIEEEAGRESEQGEMCEGEDCNKGETFNTLTSLKGQRHAENIKFGDYIVQKWKDVFRANKAY